MFVLFFNQITSDLVIKYLSTPYDSRDPKFSIYVRDDSCNFAHHMIVAILQMRPLGISSPPIMQLVKKPIVVI